MTTRYHKSVGFRFMTIAIGIVLLVFTTGCQGHRSGPGWPSPAAAIEAEGIFVRHLRLRLAPSHTQAFEKLMGRCVQAAQAAGMPEEYDWLCYRESPGRYWLIFFSETIDGFATPESLRAFALHLARAEGGSGLDEISELMVGLDYETEWVIIFQQKSTWSTVEGMSTSTHSKARIMDRTIRPGMEEAFEDALAARTAFLVEHGYELPIEGFVTRRGAPGRELQVVFPVDWSSFHEKDSFGAFIRGLDDSAQAEYAGLKRALMVTMDRAEYYDGDYAGELSYSAE
ncbi:MAG: hypothetical protein IID30_09630 [Planctomycetes bacterium]|nr:hypothetical protein [Planctomycetota bacterium]MCH7604182.1 hypothetical protein [Planctomycetota bacterium]